MEIKGDVIFDSIKNRNNLIKWKILTAFLAVIALAVIFSSPQKGKTIVSTPYIARIYIDGEIVDDFSRRKSLTEIAEDHNIKAVILQINSPGGGFFASEDLYHSLRKISEKKPIVAVINSIATSGGYLAAVATDYIVARYSSATGSIGVIFSTFNVEELTKKLGVNFYDIKTPRMKAEPSIFKKPSDEVVKTIQEDVADGYKFFAGIVANRRKIKTDFLMSVSDGRVFNGQKAMKLGLIDQLGGEEEALYWLREHKKINPKLEVTDYFSEKNPIKAILEDMGTMVKNAKIFSTHLFNNHFSGLKS